MANNRLTPEAVVRTGLAATYLTDGAGAGQLNVTDTYQVNNDEAIGLHFKKSGAGACIVTIVTPGTVDGLAIPGYYPGMTTKNTRKKPGPKPMPAHKRVAKVTISLPPALHRRLAAEAERKGIGLSTLIAEYLGGK